MRLEKRGVGRGRRLECGPTRGVNGVPTRTIGRIETLLHLRILPPLVMHPVLERTFLVIVVDMFVVYYFCFVEELMVKAEDLLILFVVG